MLSQSSFVKLNESLLSIKYVPDVGFIIPDNIFNIVVLPEPDLPIIDINPFSGNLNDISSSAIFFLLDSL